MAHDKKGFILYADQISTILKVPDDMAGKLFKLIYSYVNDEEPIIPEDDLLLQILFEPIRLQLKRDLVKFEVVRQKRIEAGRNGGLKTQSRKDKQNEASASNAKAKQAVTVTVNDNDTVTDNDIKEKDFLSEESKPEDFEMFKEDERSILPQQIIPALYIPSEEEKSVAERKKAAEIYNSHQWQEQVTLKYGLTRSDFINYLDDFITDQKLKEELLHKSLKELKSHFINWLKIQIQKHKNEKNGNSKSTNTIDAIGKLLNGSDL